MTSLARTITANGQHHQPGKQACSGEGGGGKQAGHAACPAAKVVRQKPHTHSERETVCSLVSALDAALGVH